MRSILSTAVLLVLAACGPAPSPSAEAESQSQAVVLSQQALYSDFATPFSGTSFMVLDDVAPASSATTLTGWTVGKTGAGYFSTVQRGVERSTITFLTAVEPTKPPRDVAGNALVRGPLTGTYAAGDWLVAVDVVAVTRFGANGRMRVRVRKGPDLHDGFSAVDVSAGSFPLSTVTSLSTSSPQTSSGLVPVSQNLSFANEYLFVQLAWEVTASAGNNQNTDVLIRSSTSPVVTTTDFF